VLLASTNGAKNWSNSSVECFGMARMIYLGTDRNGGAE